MKSNLTTDADYLSEWIGTASALSDTDQEILDPEDGSLASRLYASCMRVLQGICWQLSASKATLPGADVRMLKEELGRLYLLGEALDNGKLDKALQDADDLRESFLELLASIGRLLVRRLSPIVERLSPNSCDEHAQDLQELESLIEKSEAILSNEVSTNGSVGEEEDDDGNDSCTSGVGIDEDLRSRVQLAMDLVPSLESTLSHVERLQRQSAYISNEPFHASNPAQIYISLVRDKFPEANNKLIERLGEANWQRHINIRRRLEKIEAPEEPVPLAIIRAETVIGSKFQPETLFHDSAIGTSISARSYNVPPDAVQVLTAPSEASHTSFISGLAEMEKGGTRVPPTPAEVSLGKPFRCYLCGHLLSMIKNRVGWKLHVFRDLLPYICTIPNCKEEFRQFPSRDAWFEHELQEHHSVYVWDCSECPAECSDSAAWSTHLKETHGRVLEPIQNLAAADAARR